MSDDADRVEYACSSCGGVNRIPRARLLDGPKCGHCHRPIFPDRPVAAGAGTWRAEVEACPIPVLVDFWAPWCAPCRTVAPVLDAIARERRGRLKIVKLNTEESPQVAARYGIRSIPTMILFRGPLVLDQVTGALPKVALDARLSRWV